MVFVPISNSFMVLIFLDSTKAPNRKREIPRFEAKSIFGLRRTSTDHTCMNVLCYVLYFTHIFV